MAHAAPRHVREAIDRLLDQQKQSVEVAHIGRNGPGGVRDARSIRPRMCSVSVRVPRDLGAVELRLDVAREEGLEILDDDLGGVLSRQASDDGVDDHFLRLVVRVDDGAESGHDGRALVAEGGARAQQRAGGEVARDLLVVGGPYFIIFRTTLQMSLCGLHARLALLDCHVDGGQPVAALHLLQHDERIRLADRVASEALQVGGGEPLLVLRGLFADGRHERQAVGRALRRPARACARGHATLALSGEHPLVVARAQQQR